MPNSKPEITRENARATATPIANAKNKITRPLPTTSVSILTRSARDPARIASTSTVTSLTSPRTFMLTATICRPNSGLILSNWQATLDFAPTNCARYNH